MRIARFEFNVGDYFSDIEPGTRINLPLDEVRSLFDWLEISTLFNSTKIEAELLMRKCLEAENEIEELWKGANQSASNLIKSKSELQIVSNPSTVKLRTNALILRTFAQTALKKGVKQINFDVL